MSRLFALASGPCLALVVLLVVAARSPTVAAQGTVIDRCRAGSRESGEAGALYRALLEAVGGDEPLAGLRARVAALLAHPCLAASVETSTGRPTVATRESFVEWWQQGGSRWLQSYAEGLEAGGRERVVVLPPDERTLLAPATLPAGSPLAGLVCPLDDERCGRETAGWALRADEAFDSIAQLQRARVQERGPDEARAQLLARCEREARAAPGERQYPTWYWCAIAAQPRRAMMPVGRIRAPSRGWLVLRGRRGHYQFCDEIRAYDLSRGSAHVASTCGALAFVPGGAREPSTRAGPRITTSSGRVSAEHARELAWALSTMGSVAVHAAPRGMFLEMPAWLPTRWRDDGSRSFGFQDTWATSAQTTLAWSWWDGRVVRASGTLTWPDSSSAAEAHADHLVRVLEAGLVPGCAPARLPRALPLDGPTGGVSRVDAEPSELARLQVELVARLRAEGSQPCRGRAAR